MGEIININVGKAGIRIGQKFLNQIAYQHFGSHEQPIGKYNVFFQQTQQKNFFSRSIFLDMDSRTIDKINRNAKNFTISEQNLFKGTGLYSDNFIVGKSHEGAEIADMSLQRIRKQTQKCDRLSGFLLISSIAGGSGGGMDCRVLENLRQAYCGQITEQHFVLPQKQISSSPTHAYNTILAAHYSLELTDLMMLAQNDAFLRKLMANGNIRPSLEEVNQVHAQQINDITAPYRFKGNLNTSQRKTCTNLIPFPRLKILVSSCSNKNQKGDYLWNALHANNCSKKEFFQDITGRNNPYITDIYALQVSCRDNLAYQTEIDTKISLWLQTKKLVTTDWIPHTTHLSISQQISPYPAACVLYNSRNVIHFFNKWVEIFGSLFRKRAFIHHYRGEGMDEMEFTEAQSNINDFISEHTPYGEPFIDQENDYNYYNPNEQNNIEPE